jgi:predicted O-linked N-acetylglucosamine transferase (SPINDLY family)
MDPSTSAWAAARLAPIQVRRCCGVLSTSLRCLFVVVGPNQRIVTLAGVYMFFFPFRIQMVIWGHPSTTGYTSIDYYLTSEKFHRHTYTRHLSERAMVQAAALDSALVEGASTSSARGQESPYAYSYFAEQLVQFDTLGFYFARPVLDADLSAVQKALSTAAPAMSAELASQATRDYLPHILRPRDYYQALARALKKGKAAASKQLRELIIAKLQRNASIALCPQHMPKFHPDFDVVMTTILLQSPNSLIVLVDNRQKLQWRRTLVGRWRAALMHALQAGDNENSAAEEQVEGMLSRIMWVSSLTPQEYLTLLAIGDVMLDPFPFGGGVTTLESIAVCTPVITLPSGQSVPQLGAGAL